jgi:tRNA pseudouridine synthase 10
MIIPAEVQEREDQLRSDLQVRGMETIKSQTAKEITDFVRKKTGRRIDRGHPELTVLVDLDRDEVSATAKSLFVYGRYTKPKGVSQRREFCEKCSGGGCSECRGGYVDTPSMEEVLGRRFTKILRSSRAKFTWIGSEDVGSVVYPPGRPFIVEVKDPRLRRVPARLTLVTGRGAAKVAGARVLKGKPTSIPSFSFKTRAFIEPLQPMGKVSLLPVKKIRGATVEYRNNKGKTVYKKVYSILLERKGKGLVAEIKLDGGLPVKRLVSGESASPSISELLKVPLVCQRFDILRVWESGSVRFGTQRRVRDIRRKDDAGRI